MKFSFLFFYASKRYSLSQSQIKFFQYDKIQAMKAQIVNMKECSCAVN